MLPLFHIYALTGIMLGAVRNGNQLILYPRPDIDMIVNDLAAKKKPTFLPGVPTLYTAINKHPKAARLDLKALKICMSGGAPLPVEVQNALREADRRHPDRGLRPDRDLADRRDLARSTRRAPPGSCGVPMPGTIIEIRDMDDPDRVLPPARRTSARSASSARRS